MSISAAKPIHLAEKCVRLVLLRVQPGQEVELGRLIEKRCLAIGVPRKSFRIFRLFGSYDLAFLQQGASLGACDFVRLGSLPYVTGSVEHMCYTWEDSRNAPALMFDIEKLRGPLLGLCFLKINPELIRKSGLTPEVEFAAFLRKQFPSAQIVGSLGWFEVVVLLSGDSVKEILQTVSVQLAQQLCMYQQESMQFTEKTLSMLGHALAVSDRSSAKASRVNLVDKDKIAVKVALSCRAGAMETLADAAQKYFASNGNAAKAHIDYRLGSWDMDLQLSLDRISTLNELIQLLDKFRAENAGILLKTYTDVNLRGRTHNSNTPPVAKSRSQYVMLELSSKAADQMVKIGPEGAAVATLIYRYNSLIGNGLVADAYKDLLGLVYFARQYAQKRSSRRLKTSERHFLAGLVSTLGIAMEQRSEGVYTGIEQTPFFVASTGISMQRVTVALEAFIHSLFEKQRKDWRGCVVFGYSRFEQTGDTVVIPLTNAFAVGDHWAMIHEIMHLLQNTSELELSPTRVIPDSANPIAKEYRNPGSQEWQEFVEIVADVLAFAMTCPLQVEKYIDVVWNYLSAVVIERVPLQSVRDGQLGREVDRHDANQLRAYLFRTFAVLWYVKIGKDAPAGAAFNPNEAEALLVSHSSDFQKHNVLRPLFRQNRRGETSFRLLIEQFNAEVGPVIPIIRDVVRRFVNDVDLVSNVAVAESLIEKLFAGETLLPDEIATHAHTIAWLMAGRKTTDRAAIAWVLSLWNLYHLKNLSVAN